ncbi:hypothetical protein EJB05_46589, partial [Eragrostis curvula]
VHANSPTLSVLGYACAPSAPNEFPSPGLIPSEDGSAHPHRVAWGGHHTPHTLLSSSSPPPAICSLPSSSGETLDVKVLLFASPFNGRPPAPTPVLLGTPAASLLCRLRRQDLGPLSPSSQNWRRPLLLKIQYEFSGYCERRSCSGYLAEARDKICRAIQYGSKFLSNGQPGPAQNVDKSTSLARKVFRLFKFVNDLHALISPPAKGTPLPLILLGKSKNAMLSTFLFLDQIVWAGRTGIYKNKERAEFLSRIAFYCFLGSNTCTTIIELAELQRLSISMKKLEKELKHQELHKNEQYRMKLQKSNERLLAVIKSSLDIVVAVGLLQLAPKKVTPRVTGAFGFASSLIACYQLLPSAPKSSK